MSPMSRWAPSGARGRRRPLPPDRRPSIDHGAHSSVVDGAHDRGSLLHGVDDSVWWRDSVRCSRQRTPAPPLRQPRRNNRCLACARRPLSQRRARVDRASHGPGRGHQDRRQPAQCAHDVDRAVALACIGRSDRQPGRCAQRRVQAGDGDPGISRSAAPRRGFRSWQTGRVIGQRERAISIASQPTLRRRRFPFEQHRSDHFVAECDAHVVSSSAGMSGRIRATTASRQRDTAAWIIGAFVMNVHSPNHQHHADRARKEGKQVAVAQNQSSPQILVQNVAQHQSQHKWCCRVPIAPHDEDQRAKAEHGVDVEQPRRQRIGPITHSTKMIDIMIERGTCAILSSGRMKNSPKNRIPMVENNTIATTSYTNCGFSTISIGPACTPWMIIAASNTAQAQTQGSRARAPE